MKIVRSKQILPSELEGSVLAIGNFDGVHKGHQVVIGEAVRQAQMRHARAGVMTFEPHPRTFFNPGKKLFRLTDEKAKMALFQQLQVDLAVVVDFNETISQLAASAFVEEMLISWLKVSHIVTGFDFLFGKGREGTPQTLSALAEKQGVGVTIVEAQRYDGAPYASRDIRSALRSGLVEEAAAMLGYWWRVYGVVETGDARGRELGFPTANVTVPSGIELQHGVYAVRAYVDGAILCGAAYLGRRQTFQTETEASAKLEVYLFDFGGDIYGKEIAVEFLKFLRSDEIFDDSKALGRQIEVDCRDAERALKIVGAEDPYKRLGLGASLS